MKLVLAYIGVLALSVWLLWVFFVALAHIKTVHLNGGLTKTAYVFAIPTLIVGILIDLVVNIMFTLIFLDLPREITLSSRLNRYVKGMGWRADLAWVLAGALINNFDKNHIRKEK